MKNYTVCYKLKFSPFTSIRVNVLSETLTEAQEEGLKKISSEYWIPEDKLEFEYVNKWKDAK